MSLISKTSTIIWSPSNKKYYIDKGYEFTSFGDTCIVNVEDLSKSSSYIVDVQCDFCYKIFPKTYKEYNNLRGNLYCCPDCLKHNKRYRDSNGNLVFIDIPHRNKEWLYNEYIVKGREAQDIADECNINVRTLREWLNIFNISNKRELKTKDITKEDLEELYVIQHKTSEEI